MTTLRVAIRLRAGNRGFSEQVHRGGHRALPQLAQHRLGVAGIAANDEAMGHMPDAGCGGCAEYRATRPCVGDAHGRLQRHVALLELSEETHEVLGQVVERAAGRYDVDEAKQRGPEFLVARRQLHGPIVEHVERPACRAGKRLEETAADRVDLSLQGDIVHGETENRRRYVRSDGLTRRPVSLSAARSGSWRSVRARPLCGRRPD